MPPAATMFGQLGLSLLLGLLVGLQREHAASGVGGMRTFPLIALLGTVLALLSGQLGGWIVAAGLLGIAAVLIVGTLLKVREQGPADLGITTGVAGLLMYAVGALLVVAPMEVAVAIGGGVAVLLQYKPELHGFARRLGDEDLRAIMQFVLITCIVLPVLPDKAYGPFHVLNPWQIWLIVVLIVGMSLGGYIAYKFLGRDANILLGGVLGGAISSTATTVSYARSARAGPVHARASAVVIMIASTVLFVRVLIALSIVSPEFAMAAAPPVVVLMLLTMVPALLTWYRVRGEPGRLPDQENPTQLKSALVFAAMYAVVLVALAGAQVYLGGRGLYAVAAISGLPDMDAITLSAARMVSDQGLDPSVGWRLIVVAAMANFVFKSCIAGVLGGWPMLCRIARLFAAPVIGGALLLALWPA
jgi:uncharacterized membrane protein (DUF4010 family)